MNQNKVTTMKKYESFYQLLRETDVNEVLEAVDKCTMPTKGRKASRKRTRVHTTNCCTCNPTI